MKTATLKTQQQPSYTKVKNLLSKGSTNAKTAKNEIETFILYLAPSDIIGTHNLCPFASDGCRKACLYSAGRGAFSNVQQSRINKTKFWAYDRESFYIQLANEILAIHSKTVNQVAIRLNGTSDVDHLGLIFRYTGINFLSAEYSNILFYDYTKSIKQIEKYKGTNYKLTFSLSETNQTDAIKVLLDCGNIAAVFSGELPQSYKGFKVIDGDKSDLRYFDPSNVIVGLKAKGQAKKDTSGFVITKY
jgi:hypothetical protein